MLNMNKLRTILTWGLLSAAAHVMGYSLTVSPIEIEVGQSTNLIINLNNTETNLTAYQMKLFLPTGITVQKKSNGKYAYTANADRHDGAFTFTVKDAADGSVLIAVFSSDKDVIAGTSGELIRLPLEVASTVTTSLQGSLKEIEFTDVNRQAYTISDVNFTMTLKEGSTPPDVSSNVTVSVPNIETTAGSTKDLIINMQTDLTNLTAYQMKLFLPTGVTVQKKFNGKYAYTANADRHDGAFTFTVKDAADGSVLIAVFSSDKDVIAGTSGELIRLPLEVASTVTTSLQGSLKEIEFTDVNTQAYTISDVNFTLKMNEVTSPNITFEDANVKAICVANWDTNGDGELSEAEAAAVTDLGTAFRSNNQIKKFDELQYFTGLTCICDSAFMNCKYLADITLPQNVTSIGTRAFHACSNSLQTVSIPSKVTSIGDYTFHNCYKLTSIVIPKKVTKIGNYVFYNCESLASISVESGNTKYDSRGNCNAIIQTATNTLIAGCKNTVIPEGVTAIGIYAFRKATGLTSVTIPQSVTSIGKYAFSGCSNLTDVWCYATSIPTTGKLAFDATTLASATLHVPAGSLEAYSTTEPWSNFANIVSTDGETSPLIDFADAKTKAVCIANWDTSGDGELSEEEAAAVTDLGTAFRNNSQIKKFDELQYFTGLTSICDSAFMNCKYLADITLPQNVTSIGTRAFHACSNSLQTVSIPSKVTSIGDYTFHNCYKLTSIVIPKKVTKIGNYVFYNCESLASISVESGNTKYDSRGNCNAIIQTATNTLIAGCKNTVIPEGVTAIGTYAFRKATGLTSITIPQSVTNIGKYAFSACSNLTDVWCYATSVPTTGSHAFDAVPFASATLHVPYPALNDYRTTAPWSDFGTIVAIEGTEPDIALSPADITVRGGQQVKLPIELNNGTDIDVVGISFTLVLPDGVSVAEDNDGDPVFALASDRLNPNQFFVYSNQLADGSHAFRIVANSASAIVEGTEGAVMTVTLNIAAGMRAGNYSIGLTDNSLSVKDNDNIAQTTKLADASSTLTVSNTAGSIIMGDVNGDGDVDISDAIMVVYRSLNKPLACFNEDAADMNGDSEIDLSDAINIIYKILGLQNGSNARRRNVAAAENSDILQLNGSDNSFGMSLEGEGSYVGFQCDIKLPEGMSLASVSLSQDRAASHTVMYNRQDDGTYRIVAFSATAKAFSGNMGELMTFTTEGDEQGEVSVENIFFVNTTLQKVAFANLSAIATGISGIEETKASKGVIYDLSGKAVSNPSQQGVIIVNGKKIVNK